ASQGLKLHLPSDPSAPAVARAAVANLEGELSRSLVQKLGLIASELVTNSLRHAMVTDPAPTLKVAVSPSVVTISVHDQGSSFDLDSLSGEPGTGGGWGLKLVDSLVDRWRVERGDGTRVIGEIDRR